MAIVRPDYGVGAVANVERHLADVCAHQEIRSMLADAIRRDHLRPSVLELLQNTTD